MALLLSILESYKIVFWTNWLLDIDLCSFNFFVSGYFDSVSLFEVDVVIGSYIEEFTFYSIIFCS